MRRLFTLAALIVATPAAAASLGNSCADYVGQTISPIPIAQVFSTLPAFPARDAYESTANYKARLEGARKASLNAPIVIDRPWNERRPVYDADKQTVPLYEHELGLYSLNFGQLLRLPASAAADPFGGIGFQVTRTVTSQSSYEANNGFGAKVSVQHQDEAIDAIWEGPLKILESPFLDVSGKGPVITLQLDPVRARDVIEQGGLALVAIPKAPFLQEGVSTVAPTFKSPQSFTKTVRVLWADVRCELIYDGSRTVVGALAVK